MKISILCSDVSHPVMPSLRGWQRDMSRIGHEVSLCSSKQDLVSGDVLFLVSCSELVTKAEREKFTAALVLHASDLPEGRGWSPHIWSIVEGASHITLCLIEAADPIDSGSVWIKTRFELEGHELLPEINDKLFACETDLMTEAVQRFGEIQPVKQEGAPGRYLRKRTPADSQLDVHESIAGQFDLLRVVDNQRYPAFVDYRGNRYVIKIEKVDNAS